jgi:hypothetical protein
MKDTNRRQNDVTFTSQIQDQPSTRIHGRPGIGMKQKIQAEVVSDDDDMLVHEGGEFVIEICEEHDIISELSPIHL